MSSDDFGIVAENEAVRLDELVTRIAREFRLPQWSRGITVEFHPDGRLRVKKEQFVKLLEDLSDHEKQPLVKQLNDMLVELDLTKVEPNYEEFRTLLEEKISGVERPKIVFMLGAGASKPEPSNIPTINEMLGVIVSKLPPRENPMANKIREWSSRKNVTIEDIMTAGYLSSHLVGDMTLNTLVGEIIYRTPARRKRTLTSRLETPELRDIGYVVSFKDLVDRIFSIVSGIMIKADSNPVHESIARLIKNRKDDFEFHILTTNYDVCIEKALEKQELRPTYLGMEKGDGVPIVKIHGSINWFYCEGCQDLIIFDIEELKKYDKVYPTTASCLKCNTLTELFMIPPIAYKYVTYPPVVEIWQSAMKVLEEADLIIVIGYSFSLADDYILKLIINGLKKKSSSLVYLTRSRSFVNSLQSRLLAYHERINLPLVEDAAVSTPIICEMIEGFSPEAPKESGN